VGLRTVEVENFFSFITALACHLSDYARIMPTLPTYISELGSERADQLPLSASQPPYCCALPKVGVPCAQDTLRGTGETFFL
jgi:hypothetical protein